LHRHEPSDQPANTVNSPVHLKKNRNGECRWRQKVQASSCGTTLLMLAPFHSLRIADTSISLSLYLLSPPSLRSNTGTVRRLKFHGNRTHQSLFCLPSGFFAAVHGLCLRSAVMWPGLQDSGLAVEARRETAFGHGPFHWLSIIRPGP